MPQKNRIFAIFKSQSIRQAPTKIPEEPSIVRSVRPDFAFSSGIVISGRFRITAGNFAVVVDIFPDIFPEIFPELCPELPVPPKTLSTGLRQIVVTNPSR